MEVSAGRCLSSPGDGAESLGLDRGEKGETAIVWELVGITGPSATPLPSPAFSVYLHGLPKFFCLIRCVYLHFFSSFVLRRAGELLDGKQSGCQDKVFFRIRGLFVGVFFPPKNQFLELPVRRQRVNSPLDLTAWERCDPGLKYGWVKLEFFEGFFCSL